VTGADASAAPPSRTFVALFFLLVLAALAFSDKGQIAGDGVVRWRALVALMDEHRLTPDRYTLEMPLAAIPLWAAGDAAARAGGEAGPARLETIGHVVQRFNKVVAFAIAVWLFGRLRRLGLGERGAAGGVLCLLFASLLIPHSKDFYSEGLWTLFACVALGLLADGAARTRGGDALLLVSTALAIPLNPLLFPVIVVTSASLYFLEGEEGRAAARRGAGLSFVGSALGASLAFAENLLRRGAFLDFGYAGEGFTAAFIGGFFGQLFSPARGALFYLPLFFVGFVLAARGSTPGVRRFALAGTAFGVLLVLAYAKWHAWHGMTYWGPRFLLPLSIFGVAFFALAWREFSGPAARAALVALLVLSYAAYKVGVGVGVVPLRACLLPDAARLSCYWDRARLPLAAWLLPGDLASMLSHRSTAVEVGTLVLFAALGLVTGRGRSRPAISPPGPAPRSG
jgi:hypothetical protein